MKTKKRRNGFGFRMAQAIILFVGGIAVFLMFRLALPAYYWVTDYIDYLLNGGFAPSASVVDNDVDLPDGYFEDGQDGKVDGLVYYEFSIVSQEDKVCLEIQEKVYRYDYIRKIYIDIDSADPEDILNEILSGLPADADTTEYYGLYNRIVDAEGIKEYRELFKQLLSYDTNVQLDERGYYRAYLSDWGESELVNTNVYYSPLVSFDEDNRVLYFEPVTLLTDISYDFQIEANSSYNSYINAKLITTIYSTMCAVIVALSIVYFFLAFAGRKSRGANIACVAVSGIFCCTGVCIPVFVWGLIGGIKGLNANRKKVKLYGKKVYVTYKGLDKSLQGFTEENAFDFIRFIKKSDKADSLSGRQFNFNNSQDNKISLIYRSFTIQNKDNRQRLYLYFSPSDDDTKLLYMLAIYDKGGACTIIEERDSQARKVLRDVYAQMLEDERIREEESRRIRQEALSASSGDNMSAGQSYGDSAQTEVKQPNKKLSVILLAVVSAYYIFLLVFGILCVAMPAKGFAWGPYEDADYTVAINYCTGFMLVLLVPSLGYYFAFRAPFRFSRLVRIVIVSFCLGITVVGDVLYFVLAGKYLGLLSTTMKIAPFLAEIGLIALYMVGFIKILPESFTKKVYESRGNTWADLLGKLFTAIRNILFKLLKMRHSSVFIICGIVLFTLCLFVLLELLYVLLGVVAVLLIIAICSALYMPSAHTYQRYTVTDSSGSLRELSYVDYNNFTGEYIYKDNIGNTWATTDSGKNFYPITDDNARRTDESKKGNFIDYK